MTGRRPPDAPSRVVRDELVPSREAALATYRPRFLKAIDRALSLEIDRRPKTVAAWRTELLALEPEAPLWRRTLGVPPVPDAAVARATSDGQSLEEALAEGLATATAELPPAGATVRAPKVGGGLVSLFARVRDRREGKEAAAVPPAAALPPRANEIAAKPAPARTTRPPPEPQKSEKEPVSWWPRSRPRPMPGRATRWISWRPLLVKLSIGAGVAAIAVGFQDRLPGLETRGVTTLTSASPSVEPIRHFRGHEGSAVAAEFAGGGRYLITVGTDQKLRVWDPSSGGQVRKLDLVSSKVTSLAVEGSRAATGHQDGTIVVYDIEYGREIARMKRNEATVWSLAFAGSETSLLAASHDWTFARWDTTKPQAPARVYEGHESAVEAIAYVAEGDRVLTGSADKSVRLWDLDSGSLVRTFRGHDDFVSKVAVGFGGHVLASGGLDGVVRLWQPGSSRRLRSLTPGRGPIGALAASPTANDVAVGTGDGVIRIYDTRRGHLSRAIGSEGPGVTGLAYAPDGKTLAAAYADGSIRLWAGEVGRRLAKE